MKTRWILLVLLLSLTLGSCTSSQARDEESPSLPPSEPIRIPTETPTDLPLQLEHTPESTEMPSAPAMEKLVVLAKRDLASRLGVDDGKINLVKAEEKLWLNAALGCPRPGVFYPSGRVPGFQIWLEVEGTQYVYNTDFNGTLVLCPELNPHVPGSTNDPTPGVPIR